MATVRQIITRAFGELQYYAEGETPSADAMSDGLDALNDLLLSWWTQSMLMAYPSSVTWKGAWTQTTIYAVNDAVNVAGVPYTCTVAHTSSFNDLPGGSINWASYWTELSETVYTIDQTFTLPRRFHRGFIAMMALEMAPKFNVSQINPLTMRKARDGETALLAEYMPIQPAQVDSGLIRLPSQVWPYNVGTVT